MIHADQVERSTGTTAQPQNNRSFAMHARTEPSE
jgi:hypothetical protein